MFGSRPSRSGAFDQRLVPLVAAALFLVSCAPAPHDPAASSDSPAPRDSGAPQPPPELIGELRVGEPAFDLALAPGQTHVYRLQVAAGRFLRLVVEQDGIDVAVALRAPGGAPGLEVDRPIGDTGAEPLVAVTGEAGERWLSVHGGEWSSAGRYRVHWQIDRPASAEDRRLVDLYRRYQEAAGLPEEQKAARWEAVLEPARELGAVQLLADAAQRLADRAYRRRERPRAADLYRSAAEAYARAGERGPEANARIGLANDLVNLAEGEEALVQYRLALELAQGLGDRALGARAHHGLGRAWMDQGELQSGLDHFEEALRLSPEDNRGRPYILHELGVLYARHLDQVTQGREYLEAALEAWPEPMRLQRARTLNQLGQLALEGDAPEPARGYFEQVLDLARDQDRCLSVVTEARLALVDEAEGRPAAELECRDCQECPAADTTVRMLAAALAERRGDAAGALERHAKNRDIFARRADRAGEAESLAGIARSLRSLGRTEQALAASGKALEILEGVRATVLREDLRTSFFTGAQAVFDLHIGLLLDRGRDEEAWVAAERARAQALRDLLVEAGAGLRRSANPALAVEERSLQHRLNALESRRLGSQGATTAGGTELVGEIDRVVEELLAVRGEIRRVSPDEAALLDAQTLESSGLRSQLGKDALLLEYRLGEERSTLWAVTRDSVEAWRLPPRGEIEAVAEEVGRYQQSLQWPGHPVPSACELSRLLLGPVAERLDGRRLLLVPDGVLETLSFAALPDPTAVDCRKAAPLVASHEIVYLPSVATLATQRRRFEHRALAPGWLAVVADPVYKPGDPRLAGKPSPSAQAAATRSAAANTLLSLDRLPGTGVEARSILADLPAARTLLAEGPEANKKMVLGGGLAGYRILHFATHGVLNERRPMLSFLALSQLDGAGRPIDGTLYAHEIYQLDLPAELVVLSACDTARGRSVRGEGLVAGLPRAFLYAGAARVLMSLWSVPDTDTRELMERFYHALVEEGRTPAEALQQAQRQLWLAGRPPFRWAAFALQGETDPLPPFSD